MLVDNYGGFNLRTLHADWCYETESVKIKSTKLSIRSFLKFNWSELDLQIEDLSIMDFSLIYFNAARDDEKRRTMVTDEIKLYEMP